jgi:dTDP-4-dehydrorhamnose 3,5-epimerase
VKALAIDGAWLHTPVLHGDDRGTFGEWFRGADFAAVTGHRMALAQANVSVSRRGVIRGIHFADVPPGQAKYVTCARGAILDVVVDIRVGSPTFGRWDAIELDDQVRSAVYIAEGLGHAFCALTDEATAVYLCSEPYAPGREHALNALDPELGIAWPADLDVVLSDKDAAAPGLAAGRQAGMLPTYDACIAYRAQLRAEAT